MFINVRPVQKEPVKWPWKNVIKNGYPFVSESPGEVIMPSIMSPFDWHDFEYGGEGCLPIFGSRDMKSIFTTYCRFVGVEKALINLQEDNIGRDLDCITQGFIEWNEYLLKVKPNLSCCMIGDDVAYNQGLLMSPLIIQKHLAHRWDYIYRIYGPRSTRIFHSDGDIISLLPILYDLMVDVVLYEPVGQMRYIEPYKKLGRILFVPVKHSDNEPFAGYMPEGDHE